MSTKYSLVVLSLSSQGLLRVNITLTFVLFLIALNLNKVFWGEPGNRLTVTLSFDEPSRFRFNGLR